LLGPALISSAVALSGHARADDAQALFDEGLGNMKTGRYKIGCALIRRSLDVDARLGTLFTLAECYSRAGKYASSVALYDRFLGMYESMPPEQREQQAARAELSHTERTRLVALVSWLTVRLPASAPTNVVVTLDGEAFARGMFGVATAVDPGPHVFTTRAPDGPLIEQRIDITPGERKATELEVRTAGEPRAGPPVGDTPAPETPNPGAQTKQVTPWVYVAGGFGAAGLITGSISGIILLQKRKTILADCPEHVCGSAEGKAAVDSAQNVLAPLATVALGVGLVGTLTAIALLVSESSSDETASGRGAVPTIGFTRGGASVGVQTVW
jgi:hypothetical protein